MAAMRCTRCTVRFAQERGLCRTCSKEQGLVRRRESDRLTERQHRAGVQHPPIPPDPPVFATYDGRAFEVIWNGVCPWDSLEYDIRTRTRTQPSA